MLTLLCLLFKDIPRQLQNQVWISYDNMCNVVKMRAAQRSLRPSFGKFSDVWKETNKMIDGLHISNHKDAFCKEQLGPDRFDRMYLDLKETAWQQNGFSLGQAVSRKFYQLCLNPGICFICTG